MENNLNVTLQLKSKEKTIQQENERLLHLVNDLADNGSREMRMESKEIIQILKQRYFDEVERRDLLNKVKKKGEGELRRAHSLLEEHIYRRTRHI